MSPIDRRIFNKMLFCDRIFDFIELEESLYFTALDVELHSYGAEDEHKLNIENLLDVNYKHLCAMSINLRKKGALTGKGTLNPMKSNAEIEDIIDRTLFENSYASDDCYRKIASILFDQSDQPKPSSTIFDKLAQDSSIDIDLDETEVDPVKTAKFKENYLFCRFHHLFEYEATYYSYLLAKLSSRKLFYEGLSAQEGKSF